MYCWGNDWCQQLDVEDRDEVAASEQVEVEEGAAGQFVVRVGQVEPPFTQEVLQVACGERHSLFLLQDGTVCSCGDNSKGQLGRKGGGEGRRRGPIQALEVQTIVQVSCGKEHSLAVCNRGRVFAWGAGSHGQLGIGDFKEQSLIPRRIDGLSSISVIQVACGHFHSIALSREGELYAWGENMHGQLGLQDQHIPQNSPQLVEHLRGSPLVQIAAGSAHSCALSMSGALYSWGKNTNGQLGLGNTQNQHFPIFVETLKNKKSTYISCGEDHTAVLTKDGLVYTFGSGAKGQLGHNCTRNELYPRLVTGLFCFRISQVACGRNHTLAYAPSLGKVYAFGAGEHGQLGNGKTCKQLVPLPMELPEHNHLKSSTSGQSFILKIVAGGNQSVVFLMDKKNEDGGMVRIATVDVDMADKLLADWNSEDWQKTKKDINQIFSSVACINGSFLDRSNDNHFKTSATVSGVEMSSIYLFFEKISKDRQLLQQVETAVQRLLPLLPSCPITAEAYRVYLIIPELLRMKEMNSASESLINLFANSILKLAKDKLQILECLWSKLPASFFMVLVDIFRKASSYYLNIDIWTEQKSASINMMNTLSVLQILYQVNCSAGFKIQASNFYITEMATIWGLAFNYYYFFERYEPLLQELTKFPCALDMLVKIRVFAVNKVKTSLEKLLTFAPFNALSVRRQQIVEDTWDQLRTGSQASNMFIGHLKVHFRNEPGIDEGGLSKEFFTVISRELCALKAKVFRHFDESHYIWFPNEEPEEEDTFFLIGILLGMALYNNCVANFPFPLALYKKMLNVQPTLEDLAELSPTEARNLKDLLEEQHDDKIECLCLDFTIMKDVNGSPVLIELVENGSHIPVLKYNRKRYVDAYVKYVFNTSVEQHFKDFLRGFVIGCPIDTWRIFLPAELMAFTHGNTEYDWEQLQKNAQYSGYTAKDKVIKNFWKLFHELSEEKKKRFLAFMTGTDRIPVGGMGKLIITICQTPCEDAHEYYPHVDACFHVLHLPRYRNMQTLKEKFLHALDHHETFSTP